MDKVEITKDQWGDKVEFFIGTQKIGQAKTATMIKKDDFIHAVEVVEEHRHRGYGKAIMTFMLSHYPIKYLNVAKDNIIAQKLYEKFGFRIIGNRNVDNKASYQMARKRTIYYAEEQKEKAMQAMCEICERNDFYSEGFNCVDNIFPCSIVKEAFDKVIEIFGG